MKTGCARVTQTVNITTPAAPVGLTIVYWLNGADDDYTTGAQVLSERKVRLVRVRDVDELLHLLAPDERAMCVIDLVVGSGGGQALRAIQKSRPHALVVGIVDPRHREGALEAFQKGVFDVLSEPLSTLDFASVVRNAGEFLRLADSTPDEPASMPELPGLVLASGAMRRLMELVQRVGIARCHVMIAGEFGTGRETVARLLHASSARPAGPLLKLDCNGASFPELNDTLFGRGRAEGLLGRAESGSLFLEHVEEMPSKLQGRLARVLRSAADAETTSAIRVFVAVQPDVADLVRDGKIRTELYQQFSLVRVDVPPLRDRRDDVPLLARQMLGDLGRTRGYPRKTLTRSALTLLRALPWPGNLPELRGLLERLAVMVPGGVVRLEDLLTHVSLSGSELEGPQPGATLREARMRFERDYIAATLRKHRGRMADTARALGIQRTNLYRKVRALKLTRTET